MNDFILEANINHLKAIYIKNVKKLLCLINITLIILLIYPMPSISVNKKVSEDDSKDKRLILWKPPLTIKQLQEKAYKESMNRSFNIMLAIRHLEKFGTGRIIFLYGTSSSGKSSICKGIKKLAPHYLIDSLDKAHDRDLVNVLRNFFPKELEDIQKAIAIHNIATAIFFDKNEEEFHFLKESSIELRIRAKEACLRIREQQGKVTEKLNPKRAVEDMFESAFRNSKKGKTVIIDSPDFKHFILYKESVLFNCPLFLGLVYCPFSVLSQRIDQRNKVAMNKKKFLQARYGIFPFLQFADLYEAIPSTNNITLGRLYREEVKYVIEKHAKIYAKKVNINSRKFINNCQENLLGLLHFSNPSFNSVNIAPRYPYDIIFNTLEETPEGSAGVLLSKNL
jgi:dephospho-CoA kinase